MENKFINPIIFGSFLGQSFISTPAPEDWLTGWNYRKKFSLSRPTGAVTDYQMMLLVICMVKVHWQDLA